MVTIEAENYDAAIKQARQEKRKAKRQEKIDKHNMEMSHVYGYAALGHIVDRLSKDRFHLWEHSPTIKSVDGDRIACRFETENATGETTFYRYTPLRTLLNGAGFAVGVQIQDMDKPDNTIWYAVGVYADRVALIDIPDSIQSILNEKLAAKAQKAADYILGK